MQTPDSPGRRGSWRVFAVPAGLSLLLSSITVGSQPYWQDSSIFLTAVHELGILYPHGFVLYLLSCRAWTALLSPFCDFTLAVHLFSTVCAASAAGVLALAAERFTRDRAAAIATGILASTGYTWGFAAIYAKGYALYYLLLSLLLWSALGKRYGLVALFLGLSWAAHPSFGLFAPAAIAWLWVSRRELKSLGPARLALLAAVALGAALGPILLLPILSAREPAMAVADPRSAGELVAYALGNRFTSLPGTWGLDASRCLGAARFFAEEFLLAGSVCLVAGIVTLWREDRLWLAGAAFWAVPFTLVAILFRIEGQYDLWMVAVYLALYLLCGRGTAALGERWAHAPLAVAAVAVLSTLLVNVRELRATRAGYPERFAQGYLKNLEPDAVFVAGSDDALGLCMYLQQVKGFRRDVCLVNVSELAPKDGPNWYVDRLRRRNPDLAAPAYGTIDASIPVSSNYRRVQAAFVNANARGRRAIYLEHDPEPALLSRGLAAVPAGMSWRVTVDGNPAAPELRHWDVDLRLEEAAGATADRQRGQLVSFQSGGLLVQPQSYRERMLTVLLDARQREAYLYHLQGTPEGHRRALEGYESMIAADPGEGGRAELLFPMIGSAMALNRIERAEPLLKTLLSQPLSAAMESASLWYLADVYESTGRGPQAKESLQRALRRPDLDPRMKGMIQARLSGGK